MNEISFSINNLHCVYVGFYIDAGFVDILCINKGNIAICNLICELEI